MKELIINKTCKSSLTTVGKQTDVSRVISIPLVPDSHKSLLGFLVVADSDLSLSIIEVEAIDVREVGLDRVQVDENVLELTIEEVKRGHTLSARYCVAFRG